MKMEHLKTLTPECATGVSKSKLPVCMFLLYTFQGISINDPVQSLSTDEAKTSTCYMQVTNTYSDHNVKTSSFDATRPLLATSLLYQTASHTTSFNIFSTWTLSQLIHATRAFQATTLATSTASHATSFKIATTLMLQELIHVTIVYRCFTPPQDRNYKRHTCFLKHLFKMCFLTHILGSPSAFKTSSSPHRPSLNQ